MVVVGGGGGWWWVVVVGGGGGWWWWVKSFHSSLVHKLSLAHPTPMALAIHNWSLLSIVTRDVLICIEFLSP